MSATAPTPPEGRLWPSRRVYTFVWTRRTSLPSGAYLSDVSPLHLHPRRVHQMQAPCADAREFERVGATIVPSPWNSDVRIESSWMAAGSRP